MTRPTLSALPVVLSLAGRQAEAVRRHLEGVLGWQPVEDTPGGLVPAAVRLVDVAAAERVRDTSLHRVLLVGAQDDGAAAARAAAVLRPGAVIAWPEERELLAPQVAELLAAGRSTASATRTLRVGGASGGVGTSTVVLGLAGLIGWSGRHTLAAVRPGAPVRDVQVLAPEALAAVDLWGRATPLPGAGDARAVLLAGSDGAPPVDDPSIAAAVLDEGVAVDVEVLVLRPDAAGLAAAADTPAGALVVVGSGPARPRDVAAACGPRQVVRLPRSARVARAGLHARVPTSLPGSYLRALLALIPEPLRPAHLPPAQETSKASRQGRQRGAGSAR